MTVESVKFTPGGRDAAPKYVEYEIGKELSELVSQFGEATVAANARAKIIISLQDFLRANGKRDPSANFQDLADKWVPGMRAPGQTKQEKAKAAFAALPEEERLAVLRELGIA